MSWLIKAAWGVMFAGWMLTAGRSSHWLYGLGVGWRCAIVVVVGWGPALLPLTKRKILGIAWGLGVSAAWTPVLVAVLAGSDVRISYFQFWSGLIVVGWTPLLIPAFARAKREWAFATARSVATDQNGRAAEWAFKADCLEIAVDVARRELRLRAASARWRDAKGAWSIGPVEIRRPLLECAVGFEALTRSIVQSTGVHAHGSANGVPVTVFVPTDSYLKEVPTGRHRLTIEHRSASWSIVGGAASRAPDGAVEYRGSVHEAKGTPVFWIEFDGFSRRSAKRFWREWDAKAKPLIEAARKACGEELLARAKAEAVDAFLRDESAARERRARGESAAQDRLNSVRFPAGVGSEFREMSHDVDGEIVWAIAADRHGKAAVIQGGDAWAGSLAGARAAIDIVEKGGAKTMDTLELCIEVSDAGFEREHLARRRFNIMRGWPKGRLIEWADRIQILAANGEVKGERIDGQEMAGPASGKRDGCGGHGGAR